MPTELTSGATHSLSSTFIARGGRDDNTYLADVLERVLDKGIVVDAWGRVAFVGISSPLINARVLVSSIGTYLTHAGAPLGSRKRP